MKPMGIDDIKPWVELFGTQAGIVAVLGFALWRVGKWIRPKLDTLFDRHITLIDSVQTCNEANTECVKEMRNSQKSIEKSQKIIEAGIGEQSHFFRTFQQTVQQLHNTTNK